ncbi:MAG: hypothetical protein ABIK45_10560 [Pseudomonadota bacterium]
MKLPDRSFVGPNRLWERDYTEDEEKRINKAKALILNKLSSYNYTDEFYALYKDIIEIELWCYCLRKRHDFEKLGKIRKASEKAIDRTGSCIDALKIYEDFQTVNVLLAWVVANSDNPLFQKNNKWYLSHLTNINFDHLLCLHECLCEVHELLESEREFQKKGRADLELICRLCYFFVKLNEVSSATMDTVKSGEWRYTGPLYDLLIEVMEIMGGDSSRKVIGNAIRNNVDWTILELEQKLLDDKF